MNENGISNKGMRQQQRQMVEFTPQHSVCIEKYECSDIEDAPATYTVMPVTTKAKCAKACTWTDGCTSYSWNDRRPHLEMCRISTCSQDTSAGLEGNCGKGWASTEKLWKAKGEHWAGVHDKGDIKSTGCRVEVGAFTSIELCYMEPLVPSVDFERTTIASDYACTDNYLSITYPEGTRMDLDTCQNECARRLGCRVFTYEEGTKDCRISACGIDGDHRDDTKACSSDRSNGLLQVLDGIDKAGSCFMSHTLDHNVYKIKFKKGGRVTSVSFGGSSCNGVEAEVKSHSHDYYHMEKTHELRNVPAYLFGGVIYGWPHECTWTDNSDLKISYTTGVRLYLIATAEMTMLTSWDPEPSATGEEAFQLKTEGGTTENLYVYSKHMVEGAQISLNLDAEQMGKVRAIASQCADDKIPSPIEPSITRVAGGNVSWNKPRLVHEEMLTQPGDEGWNTTVWLQLPSTLINGQYIGNHLENYLSHGQATDIKWPGQKLLHAPFWDLTIFYLPPVKICMLVWDKNNEINGKMTKKYDAMAPDILAGSPNFWQTELSHAIRNDSQPVGFKFNIFCKQFDDNPDDPGVEQSVVIQNLNGTFIGGVFSVSPFPGGAPPPS